MAVHKVDREGIEKMTRSNIGAIRQLIRDTLPEFIESGMSECRFDVPDKLVEQFGFVALSTKLSVALSNEKILMKRNGYGSFIDDICFSSNRDKCEFYLYFR